MTLRILIVDDSPTARKGLKQALEFDPGIEVVGEVADGKAALAFVRRHLPDLITMDIHLGHEDGVDVTSQIMSVAPTPILVVTGINPEDPNLAFRAMHAGALEVSDKLPGCGDPEYALRRNRLIRTVKALARVPLVTRRTTRPIQMPMKSISLGATDQVHRAVLLGASTGGPPVLDQILKKLDAPYPLPILIVQHIAQGFAGGMATWLSQSTGHCIKVCNNRLPLKGGVVYLASDSSHMRIGDGWAMPVDAPKRRFQCPSIDELFESAALSFGASVVACLFTGMGKDGAQGMAALKQRGALTIAQQPKTCVVSSMPAAAIANGCIEHVLPPNEIAIVLRNIAAQQCHGATTTTEELQE